MGLIVQKFGGTSMGSPERILESARFVTAARDAGDDVVVVVSAMAGETNRLLALADAVNPDGSARERDMLAAAGEQVSIALMALALEKQGYPAISLLADQVGIRTDDAFTRARITNIRQDRMRAELAKGKVVVVAGFQGVTEEGDISTLGRGGSDTTAVALAAALQADYCDIFTDVDGVYAADPRIVPRARKIDRIPFEAMLELANLGAKVLHGRSVEFAMKYQVPLRVRSAFEDAPGTWVVKEEDLMEAPVVSGVTYAAKQAKITIRGVPDEPGVQAKVFTRIGRENINVDVIVQNPSRKGLIDLSFTVEEGDAKAAVGCAKELCKELSAKEVLVDADVAKVSVVGVGMRTHPGVAAKTFRALADKNIGIMMITTSEIRISCIIAREYLELAVRALCEAFDLAEASDAA